MRCTGKEQLTCDVEKRGCEGCYYNDDKNKDEIKVWDYLKVLEQLIEEHKKLGDTSEETRISQPLLN